MKVLNVPRRVALMIAGPVLGAVVIIAGVAIHRAYQSSQRARRRPAFADMRTLGAALESYSVKEDAYPRTPGSAFVPTDRLAPLLLPTYLHQLPRLDGWGHPYLVRSSEAAYTIVSYGSDGRPDGPGDPVPDSSGGTTSFSNDIIFSNGSFVRFPRGGDD